MPIVAENLSHVYRSPGQPEVVALDRVSFRIEDGEFIGLIGATGSGKSTLIQHFNGLLKPTSGSIRVDDLDLTEKKLDLKELRRKVGLVFQYPEHQLFEETVRADIAFGPKNLGLPDQEITRRVDWAMEAVGIGRELADRSPFELSGGQMRRVAIAGVLAMRPKTLVLDEPTAGLDPRGRAQILDLVRDLHRTTGITVVLVTHNMEDVARLAGRVFVMNKGSLRLDGTPREIFSKGRELREYGLRPPQVTEVLLGLREKGWPVRVDVLTVEEGRREILKVLRSRGVEHA